MRSPVYICELFRPHRLCVWRGGDGVDVRTVTRSSNVKAHTLAHLHSIVVFLHTFQCHIPLGGGRRIHNASENVMRVTYIPTLAHTRSSTHICRLTHAHRLFASPLCETCAASEHVKQPCMSVRVCQADRLSTSSTPAYTHTHTHTYNVCVRQCTIIAFAAVWRRRRPAGAINLLSASIESRAYANQPTAMR